MLVLSRKTAEEILIGEEIRIKVLKTKGGCVQLGIEAPDDVRIDRRNFGVTAPGRAIGKTNLRARVDEERSNKRELK